MKQKTIYLIISMAVIILSENACKKFVEVGPPVDKLTTAEIFSNDETANASMRGLYSDMVAFLNYVANGGITLYAGLSADEIRNTKASTIYDPFANNALSPGSSVLGTNIWYKSYYHIYCANILIENLQKSTGISVAVKNQLIGEAKFLRAFFQFYLLNFFGPIPMAVSTDYSANASPKRMDSAAVYKQIVNDLIDAQSILTENYVALEKVRVNKWAATALLARVYLYQRDWKKAEEEATKLINSNAYQLSPLNGVFLANSSESILQFYSPPNTGIVTAEGNDFIPASLGTTPSFVLTDFLLAAFEPGDLRKTNWTATSIINGMSYTYPYKYKIRSVPSGTAKSEYRTVLRLAEQYLIRAEARVQQDNITGAHEDLNLIRHRAGLPETTATNKTTLLDAIYHEGQIEFFTEWGHRWFDLKRTGRIDAVLRVEKGSNWQATDALYPIPLSEMNLNPNLVQNPGY